MISGNASLTKKDFLSALVDYDRIARPIDWPAHFLKGKPLHVEIGFGNGDYIVRHSQREPSTHFVGIESQWECVYKTLQKIDISKKNNTFADNINILYLDAWIAFERLFDEKSVDCMYSLFPCPWPKKAHVKHRLFSHSFLKLLNSRLKPKGTLTIVTDFAPFDTWVKEEANETGFELESRAIKPQFDTKYERKWMAEGQKDFFEIIFVKKNHISSSVKKDAVMKKYSVASFSPHTFKMNDVKGEINIIFKDFVFDSERNRGMVQVLVCEEHLTQYVWVSIEKYSDKWRIERSEGQKFFPTEGINQAIHQVYKAVCETAS